MPNESEIQKVMHDWSKVNLGAEPLIKEFSDRLVEEYKEADEAIKQLTGTETSQVMMGQVTDEEVEKIIEKFKNLKQEYEGTELVEKRCELLREAFDKK